MEGKIAGFYGKNLHVTDFIIVLVTQPCAYPYQMLTLAYGKTKRIACLPVLSRSLSRNFPDPSPANSPPSSNCVKS